MAGPPPDDAARKRLRGSRHVPAGPPPVVALAAVAKPPPVPSYLLEDGPGREAWSRLWTAGAGWLSPKTDLGIMTRLCEYLDERYAIGQEISEDGYTVRGSQGQVRPHPLLARLQVIDAGILAIEKSCGFTPADRTRMAVVEAKPPSIVETLRAKRGTGA